MAWRNTSERYGAVSKWLHWVLAFAIIGMLAFGVYMEDLPFSPEKVQYIGWHKAIGIIILGLVIWRIIWKFTNTNPELPRHMSKKERFASHAAHGLLYVLMLYMPLTGWLMSSAAGFGVSVFGIISMPALVAPDKELAALFNEMHEIGLWAFGGLITLHVLAALFHHFYYKDAILVRMLPLKYKD